MTRILAALLLLLPLSVPARADITLGAVLSLTGPAAGLGIPARNTIELLPRTMAGQPVRWVVLDDASDTTAAVRAARKLIEEERVDAIIGPSNTPNSLALLDVIGQAGVPMVSLAGSSSIIEPPEGGRRWAFKLIPSERVATVQLVEAMARGNQRTLGTIGFANALGDSYLSAMEAQASERGIRTLLQVRYNLNDTSVTPQALRLQQARPDAVFVAASSTPATTPIMELRARGYTAPVYTIMGIAGPDALRVGGKALDGVMFSAVPVLVAEQLADAHPVKQQALAYVRAYEGRYGPGSRSLFGATLWDAFLLVEAGAAKALPAGQPGMAAGQPGMAAGQPGTPEFRRALRDGMETVAGLVGTQAVFTTTPTDHSGAQADSQVMVEIRDGGYRLLPQ